MRLKQSQIRKKLSHKSKILLAALLLTILGVSIASALWLEINQTKPKDTTVYVGVTYSGSDASEAKRLIDKVKDYTNLFVLTSGDLQRNLQLVTEIGDYAISKGLSFLPFFSTYSTAMLIPWTQNAKQHWGNKFLGLFYGEERGGKMIDGPIQYTDPQTNTTIIKNANRDVTLQKSDGTNIIYQRDGTIVLFKPSQYTTYYNVNGSIVQINTKGKILGQNESTIDPIQTIKDQHPFKNYDDAANYFVDYSKSVIGDMTNSNITTFTSDYGLYWWDYQAKCDVILAQFGWNNSANQQIALARGAANYFNKDWGVMITWTYRQPPYLESGAQMYDQLVAAYQAGAKYEIVFNYPQNTTNTYGVLTDDHFKALQDFWNNKRTLQVNSKAQAVLVLPNNYGWGIRQNQDNIWGLWNPDDKAQQIWNASEKLLGQFGPNLDMIFSDSKVSTQDQYKEIYYWNSTLPK
jgi:hypothetical protein